MQMQDTGLSNADTNDFDGPKCCSGVHAESGIVVRFVKCSELVHTVANLFQQSSQLFQFRTSQMSRKTFVQSQEWGIDAFQELSRRIGNLERKRLGGPPGIVCVRPTPVFPDGQSNP